MEVPPPQCLFEPLIVPKKTMMGPGPSNASQRVLNSLSLPIIGHLHAETLKIMDDIKEGIRYIFQTKNPVTLCVSASGHGAMETALCNLIQDSESVLIGKTGIWGERAGDMARRYGANVHFIEAKLGSTLLFSEIEECLRKYKPILFFTVQGESSTGVLQPIEGLGELCHRYIHIKLDNMLRNI